MASGENAISVDMMKNGKSMSSVYSASANYESGAISLVFALKKGDQVWIRRSAHGRTIHAGNNWFTGYLISTKI